MLPYVVSLLLLHLALIWLSRYRITRTSEGSWICVGQVIKCDVKRYLINLLNMETHFPSFWKQWTGWNNYHSTLTVDNLTSMLMKNGSNKNLHWRLLDREMDNRSGLVILKIRRAYMRILRELQRADREETVHLGLQMLAKKKQRRPEFQRRIFQIDFFPPFLGFFLGGRGALVVVSWITEAGNLMFAWN